MNIVVSLRVAVIAAVLLLATMTTPAHLARADERAVLSVTPMLGWRAGGRYDDTVRGTRDSVRADGTLGLALGLETARGRPYELFYGRQNTRLAGGAGALRVEYLHLGGLVTWPQGRYTGFVSGGLGGTRLALDSEAGSDSDLRASASLGAGVLLPLGQRLAFRLEARGYLTLTDGDSGLACLSGPEGAVCRVAYQGAALLQYEALAGLTLRF